MEEIEIDLRGARDTIKIEQVIEAACTTQDLQLVMKGTLQKYPGCIHWHFQKVKTAGTLEITYWPSQDRCWIPLRDDRAKPWVVEMTNVLKAEIERQVKT